MTSSFSLGDDTSAVEVTHISSHGLWLLVRAREHFLPYEQFPWFRDAPVAALIAVEEPRKGHFYWPALDVDLTEESIEHPERYPLVAKSPEGIEEPL